MESDSSFGSVDAVVVACCAVTGVGVGTGTDLGAEGIAGAGVGEDAKLNPVNFAAPPGPELDGAELNENFGVDGDEVLLLVVSLEDDANEKDELNAGAGAADLSNAVLAVVPFPILGALALAIAIAFAVSLFPLALTLDK